MGFLFLLYDEVYIGTDLDKFDAVRDALRGAGLWYKIDVSSVGSRLAREAMSGAGPLVINRAGIRDIRTYRVFVKRKDFSQASYLVGRLP